MNDENVRVYNYEDYKVFLKDHISSLPKAGRGQFLKISRHLNVHSTLISQIISGDKEFTLEQAYKLCRYLGFGDLESDYFMSMVQMRKAGTKELKDYHAGKLRVLASKFRKVSSRVSGKKVLSENDKAMYYSDWVYIAIWLLTGLDTIKNANDICSKLNLPLERVGQVLRFLNRTGLVVEDENGFLSMGRARTHIDSKEPLIGKHHTNWRLKAIENFPNLPEDELAFSAPLTISKKDFPRLKNEILELIEKASKLVSKSEPEELACLNIDLFRLS